MHPPLPPWAMLNTGSVGGGKEGGENIDKSAFVGGKWTQVAHDTRDGPGKRDMCSPNVLGRIVVTSS